MSPHDRALSNWKRIGEVAHRATNDDTSDSNIDEKLSQETLEGARKRRDSKLKRERTAKTMDLQYFLEMVDTKHRHGSNLRAYHEMWKESDTRENFFYWLDHGKGKYVEAPTVSREKLEKDQVRYLSREERSKYLIHVDEGRLCWAKNGERITTSIKYRDSVQGIVPVNSEAGSWSPIIEDALQGANCPATIWSSSSESSISSGASNADGEPYANPETMNAKGMGMKLKHVSPAVILNQLLQKTVKPNT